jgi:FAD/FMN-containing dehydrogenase
LGVHPPFPDTPSVSNGSSAQPMPPTRKKSRRRRTRWGARHTIRLPLLRRHRWRNHTGNESVDPIAIVLAQDEQHLIETLDKAEREAVTARCVGSGHSWSDVAITTGYLVEPQGLTGVEPVDPETVRSGADASKLVTVRSGTTIRQVNRWLAERKLALIQMGGYDGQTLAGVVSTSTHGSGVGFAPFPDYVRSLDLIDGRRQRRRIEPQDGPTEPAAFARERPDWILTKDDTTFDAAICAMGCIGMIVSLVIEVRDEFELTEVRVLSTWEAVREELLAGVPRENDHYEFYLNPYAKEGPRSNRCIVTTRNEHAKKKGARHRPWVPELLGHLPLLTSAVVQLVSLLAPERIPSLIDRSLKEIECKDGYTNASYLVYNIGSANNLRAYSAEMAVPTAGDRHIDAVDTVITTAERYRKEGSIYHTSPIAMRFVAPSRALMSMMYARETMTIELIQLVDTDGGVEILAAHQEELASLEVRPHWGQINTLAGAGELQARYPQFGAWQAIRHQLDPDGVFASPFSKRVGLTPRGVSS